MSARHSSTADRCSSRPSSPVAMTTRSTSPVATERSASGADARLGTDRPGGSARTRTSSSPSRATRHGPPLLRAPAVAIPSRAGRSASVTIAVPSAMSAGISAGARSDRASRRAATACSTSGTGARRPPERLDREAEFEEGAPATAARFREGHAGRPDGHQLVPQRGAKPSASCSRTCAGELSRSAICANTSTRARCSSVNSRSTQLPVAGTTKRAESIRYPSARANLSCAPRGSSLGQGNT